MCVWTEKRGSMNAVVLMATPCPKSLHGKGEKWIARTIIQGLLCLTFVQTKPGSQIYSTVVGSRWDVATSGEAANKEQDKAARLSVGR